jgi:hypothetical protein
MFLPSIDGHYKIATSSWNLMLDAKVPDRLGQVLSAKFLHDF